MKPNNTDELIAMSDPQSYRYGIKAMGRYEFESLLDEYLDDEYRFNKKDFFLENDDDDKARSEVYDYYRNREEKYFRALVESKVLELPSALRNCSYNKIEKLLTPIKASYPTLVMNEDNRDYSMAIKLLQQTVNLRETGDYDNALGEKLFNEFGYRIDTKKGYLESENNPDLLFENNFTQRLTNIDEKVWINLNLDISALSRDEQEYWKNQRVKVACYELTEDIKRNPHFTNEGFIPKLTNTLNNVDRDVLERLNDIMSEAHETAVGNIDNYLVRATQNINFPYEDLDQIKNEDLRKFVRICIYLDVAKQFRSVLDIVTNTKAGAEFILKSRRAITTAALYAKAGAKLGESFVTDKNIPFDALFAAIGSFFGAITGAFIGYNDLDKFKTMADFVDNLVISVFQKLSEELAKALSDAEIRELTKTIDSFKDEVYAIYDEYILNMSQEMEDVLSETCKEIMNDFKRNLKFSGHRNYSNPNQVHELMLFDTAIEATQDETAKYTNDMGDFIKWMFGFLNLR